MRVQSFKAFYMSGEVSESITFRETAEKSLRDEMVAKKYAPIVGLGPYWSTSYDWESDTKIFHLTMHGCYVGDKIKEMQGIDAYTAQPIKKG